MGKSTINGLFLSSVIQDFPMLGLRQDVGGLPVSTDVNEVKLFLLKLLLHPLETNILGLIGIPHRRRVSSVHDCSWSLIIFHELHLIELRKWAFNTLMFAAERPLSIAMFDPQCDENTKGWGILVVAQVQEESSPDISEPTPTSLDAQWLRRRQIQKRLHFGCSPWHHLRKASCWAHFTASTKLIAGAIWSISNDIYSDIKPFTNHSARLHTVTRKSTWARSFRWSWTFQQGKANELKKRTHEIVAKNGIITPATGWLYYHLNEAINMYKPVETGSLGLCRNLLSSPKLGSTQP